MIVLQQNFPELIVDDQLRCSFWNSIKLKPRFGW